MEKTIEEEIAELDAVLDVQVTDEESDGQEESTEEAGETEEETKETGEETPSGEESESESDESPAESDEKAAEKAETEEKKEDSPEEVDRYQKLLAQIDELQGQLKEKIPEEDKEVAEDLIDYLKDISMDDLDIATLNKIFNKVAQNARDNAQAIYDKKLPGMIGNQIESKMSSQDIVNQFYSANSDLKNVRNVVKACAAQVSEDHQEWTIEQVLKESALKTRETLGLPNQKHEELPSSSKAAFAKGSRGSRTKTENISALQQEIDEL